MNEIEGPKVEVRPAATLLLIDDRPDLQVFMMKRNAAVQFAGGMWVYPGGAVDEGDAANHYQKYCTHRTDEEASRLLGIEQGGLAYYVAAIREAFEEAGVMLALHRDSGSSVKLLEEQVKVRFDHLRDEVNDGITDFLSVVDQENLILDAGQIHYVARWITPPGPPRRFDTRFFVARMPKSQDPIHDDNELVNSAWLSPAEVIEKAAAKEMGMLPPTLRMIEALSGFNRADEVMTAAAANQPDERVPMAGRGMTEGPVPGAEPGWVRLRP